MPTVKEVLRELPDRFDPATAKGVNAVIQFNLTGPGGGTYHAVIRNGSLDLREGAHESPNMTMSMAAEDYLEMASGKLGEQMAFMSGKLKIAGDMGLAMRMQSLLRVGS